MTMTENDTNVKKSKLAHALQTVKLGLPVFSVYSTDEKGRCACGNPECLSPGKHPLPGAHLGFKNATLDPAKVKEMWAEYPDSNPAAFPGKDHVVIDLDKKWLINGTVICGLTNLCGKLGLEAWELLTSTYTVQTPRGGYHLYYLADQPYTSGTNIHKILGVDVRALGGYVVAAGAVIGDQSYKVINDGPMVMVPPEISALLRTPRQRDAQANTPPEKGSDQAGYMIEFKTEILRRKPAIEGEGGNDWTYRTACLGRDYGLLDAYTYKIMRDHWNHRCDPPWDENELAIIVENAYKFATGRIGDRNSHRMDKIVALDEDPANTPVDVGDDGGETLDCSPFAAFIRSLRNRDTVDDIPRGRLSLTAGELSTGHFPPPSYVISDLVLENQVNMLWGDGGTGKTVLQLNKAVAIAAGLPLFEGCLICSKVKPMPVLLVLTEDSYGMTQLRLESICRARGVKLGDLPINTYCTAGTESPVDTRLCTIADDGAITTGPFLQPLGDEIDRCKDERGLFVVLDARMDFGDFSDNLPAPVNAFTKRVLRGICQATGATIDMTAHPSKKAIETGQTSGGSPQWKNSVRSQRGFERVKDASKTDRSRVLDFGKDNCGPDMDNLAVKLNPDFTITIKDPMEIIEGAEHRYKVVVELAIEWAEQGQPLNSRSKLKAWQRAKLKERLPGVDIKDSTVKDDLSKAVDDKKLCVVSHTRCRVAGYYPPDPERALELANQAKRRRKEVKAGE